MPKPNRRKTKLLLSTLLLLLSSTILFDLLDHIYNLTPRPTTVAEPLWISLVGPTSGLRGWHGGRLTSFNFTQSPPAWLNPPDPDFAAAARDPLVLRIAFISRPNEHDRRETIRQSILKNVPPAEVKFQYKFFVGLPSSLWPDAEVQEKGVEEKVRVEAAKYGDLEILDLGEGPLYMGDKRWLMLKWGASVDPSTYDFFLGADTDSFLRLAALTRRFHFLRPHSNPREDNIIWAHMGSHIRHWSLRVPVAGAGAGASGAEGEGEGTPANRSSSSSLSPEEELDPFYDDDTKRYPYPYGMAYLLSSALVRNLTGTGPGPGTGTGPGTGIGSGTGREGKGEGGMDRLPHRVKYPTDDMMIGFWVWKFARDSTDVLDDPHGFHDPPGHGWQEEPPIEYDTICIHHVSVNEMRALRARPEWALSREWEA